MTKPRVQSTETRVVQYLVDVMENRKLPGARRDAAALALLRHLDAPGSKLRAPGVRQATVPVPAQDKVGKKQQAKRESAAAAAGSKWAGLVKPIRGEAIAA